MRKVPVSKEASPSSGHSPLATSAAALQEAAAAQTTQRYVLRLYVAGLTPRSQEAIRTVTSICEEHLAGRYELEVIDIYQQPVLAKGEQIIAAPTLIKKLPLPLRKLIGSMADKDRVLVGLDLRKKRNERVEWQVASGECRGERGRRYIWHSTSFCSWSRGGPPDTGPSPLAPCPPVAHERPRPSHSLRSA